MVYGVMSGESGPAGAPAGKVRRLPDALLRFLAKIPGLDDEERWRLAGELPVREYPKGAVLLRQGEAPDSCFFVLEGCVRQYSLGEDGTETTIEFFAEEEAVEVFQGLAGGKPSEYSLACLEDSVILVGDLMTVSATYARYPKLVPITRAMTERNYARTREAFAAFRASSPEERYKSLLESRPGLLDRVPHYLVASYLGVAPETLSRIRKRISR
jgi:CRP-like cAMP-binding protein